MSARLLPAAAPLAAALLALAAVFLAGLSQATPLPPAFEGVTYGFFLDQYPLFAFAVVYALARVPAAALAPGRPSVLRRLVGAALGLALVAALSLYPTFGGLALRGGFVMGGMAFLHQVPHPAAYALGALVAACVLGGAMEAGALAAGEPMRVGGRRAAGRLRRLGAGLVGLALRLVALWFALGLLGLAHRLGLGPWPRRPLDAPETLLAAGLVLALLPHALLVGRAYEVSRAPASAGAKSSMVR